MKMPIDDNFEYVPASVFGRVLCFLLCALGIIYAYYWIYEGLGNGTWEEANEEQSIVWSVVVTGEIHYTGKSWLKRE